MNDIYIYLKGAYVWPGKDRSVIENGCVLIQNGIIKEIGSQSEIPAPEDAQIIDYREASILPAFIDAHTHTNFLPMGPDAGKFIQQFDRELIFDIAKNNVKKALHSGVAVIFDDGGYGYVPCEIRDAVSYGQVEGADVWICRVCLRRQSKLSPNRGGDVNADSKEECEAFIRELIEKDRVDFIKLYLTRGGATSHLLPYFGNRAHFSPDVLSRINSVAHEYGRKTIAHCVTQAGIRAMIDSGGDMIAHAEFLDDNSVFTQNPELVEKIAESRIWVNPTLYTSVSNHEGILFVANGRKLTPEEQKTVDLSKAHCEILFKNTYDIWKAGARMAAGTDAGFSYFGFGEFSKELKALAETGIPVMEVLKMATCNPAEFMGRSGSLGNLERGAAANILAVKGNIFRDISAADQVTGVFKNGKRIV